MVCLRFPCSERTVSHCLLVPQTSPPSAVSLSAGGLGCWERGRSRAAPVLGPAPTCRPSPSLVPGVPASFNSQLQDFLVAQWMRIRLAMQGTRVGSLVWEIPTCHGANHWSPRALHGPMLYNRGSRHNEKPTHHTQLGSGPCLPQLEKACTRQGRLSAVKNK